MADVGLVALEPLCESTNVNEASIGVFYFVTLLYWAVFPKIGFQNNIITLCSVSRYTDG